MVCSCNGDDGQCQVRSLQVASWCTFLVTCIHNLKDSLISSASLGRILMSCANWKLPSRACRPFKLIRTGASSVVINEYAYVFGGQEPSTGMCCNDVLQFNARTMHWTMVDVKSGQPPPRHAHTCSKIGQHSFVVFGGASQNHECGSVVLFCVQSLVQESAMAMWLLSCRALNDVWVFNTMTLEWKHVVPGGAAVAGREMAAGTAVSEHQFVVTGGRGGDGVLLDDVVLLDFSGEPTWTQLLRHDSIRRCAHSAVCIHLHKAKVTEKKSPATVMVVGHTPMCNRIVCRAIGCRKLLLSLEVLLAVDSARSWCVTLPRISFDQECAYAMVNTQG